MEVNEIKEIADKLLATSDTGTAYFSIDQSGGEDEYFIRANRDGLKLYAAELLYASIVNNDSKSWGIDQGNLPWLNNQSLMIDYVRLIEESRMNISAEPNKSNLKEKLADYGCFAGMVVAVICINTGAVSIFRAIKALF